MNNRLHKGWVQFWIEHKLQPNFRLFFAAEQKWIFDVIILDKQLRCVDYNWVIVNNELDIVPAMLDVYALTKLLSKMRIMGDLLHLLIVVFTNYFNSTPTFQPKQFKTHSFEL
ncbi:hypothetical protein RHMOL_Rhmol08G0154000 [Rhododendron molle]|uniref:Uncharacterized protein n=1 Tax=Rhododendron molle TaxID=49168 RepID=A0ACC0MNU1_RHOML|nr:hypothetical protein RHMOL_Rhmol08G0154000 [Rhododendron molle]